MLHFNSYIIIAVLLISSSVSIPLNFDSKLKLFVLYNENPNELPNEHNIVTREITENVTENISDLKTEENNEEDEPSFHITDILEHVEHTLVRSALSISAALAKLNKTTDTNLPKTKNDEITNDSSTKHSIQKRYLNDQLVGEPRTLSVHMNAIPESANNPAHIAIDRVVVYVAQPGYFPLIPTFQLPSTFDNDLSILNLYKRSSNINVPEKFGLENGKNGETTTQKLAATSLKEITTISPSTVKTTESSTVASSTTVSNLKKLKNTEDDLKTKVAEIEAEPIILSTRV